MADKKEDKSEKKQKSILASYNSLLARYPFLVNATQAAIIAGLGVLLSQIVLKPAGKPLELDWVEVQVMMLINFAFNTPILLWFYSKLDKMPATLLTKLLIDQFLFSPPFTSGIIALRALLRGVPPQEIFSIIWNVVPKAQLTSWFFWIPARLMIMVHVPPMFQLLAGSVAALFWNVIFAMVLK